MTTDTSYWNESGTTDVISDGSADESLWTTVIGVWLSGALCVLGMAGNVASFIVLWRAFGHSPMFYVLRATSLADGVFLLTVFVLNTVLNACPETGVLAAWCGAVGGYIQWTVWPILMTTQMLTVWLAVLVSGERFIAICYPLRSASLCTLAKARRSVLLLTVTSVIYCIPRYFEYTVNGQGHMVKGAVGEDPLYRYVYSAGLYSLILFFLPLTLIAFLNVRLVLALQRGKKQWRHLQQRQRKEQSVTLIPLTVVATFFLCGTPSLAVNVIEALNPEAATTSDFVTFMVVANVLVVVNSASNFVIYYLLGRKFRQKLVELCCCRRPQASDSYRLVLSNADVTRQTDDVIERRRLTLCAVAPSSRSNHNNNNCSSDVTRRSLIPSRSRDLTPSPS